MRMLLLCVAIGLAACAHRAPAENARMSTVDERHGRQLFAAKCAACHGTDGRGGAIGPTLHNERTRKSLEQSAAWIKDPEPPMPKLFPAELTAKDVNDLAAYVQTL